MNEDALQIRNLMRWNRFWLTLVTLSALVGGFNLLVQHLIYSAEQLQVNWGIDDEVTPSQPALVLSSAGGGPFMVTQLAAEKSARGGIDTATAAIAQLPHPLFVRGPKARTYISVAQLARLTWIDAEGKKVAPPTQQDLVMILYYETQKLTASPAQ